MASGRAAVSHEAGQRLAASLEQLFTALVGKATVTVREACPPGALADVPGPVAALRFRLSKGSSGEVTLVLPGAAALGLARLLTGDDPAAVPEVPAPEDEDALRELANQAAGAVTGALGALLGTPVGFEGPDAQWLPAGGSALPSTDEATAFPLGILAGGVTAEAFLQLPRAALGPPPGPSPAREAALPALPETRAPQNGGGIELLLDIALPVTVELGRSRMMIRDILHLAPGSIIELDKLAGDPVDIMINDKSIARGEVVVIDENFGIRLTSIVTPSARVMNLR